MRNANATAAYPVLTQRLAYSPALLEQAWAAPEESSKPSFLGIAAAAYLANVALFSGTVGFSVVPQIMGVLLGLCWLGYSVSTGRPLIWSGVVTLYICWFVWATLGTIINPAELAFFSSWQSTAKLVLLVWLVSQCVRSRGDLLGCLFLVVITSPVVFWLGRADIHRALAYHGGRSMVESRASETLLGNANMLAIYAILVLVGAVLLILTYRSVFLRIMAGVCLAPAFYLLAAAGSRKGMVGVVLAGGLFYWYHLRRRGRRSLGKKLGMMILGGGVVVGSVAFVARLPTLSRLTDTVETGGRRGIGKEARFQYFLAGLAVVAEHPIFGVGWEGFALGGLAGSQLAYSHSTVTETLCNAGIPGFLMYFAGQFVMYNTARKLRRANLPSKDLTVVNFILIFFFVLLMFQLFAVMYDNKLTWPLLGAMCGYCVNLKHTYLRGQPAAASSS